MAEIKEGAIQDRSVLVALSGNRLAHEIKNPRAEFRLSHVYSPDAMAGNDRLNGVYFRTKSGNIYYLNERGMLTNGKESQKRGTLVQTQIPAEDLATHGTIIVGKPFVFQAHAISLGYNDGSVGGITSDVTEIVPVVTNRVYIPEVLEQITSGRKNTIKEDFNKMLPRQKVGERNEDLSGRVGQEDFDELRRTRAENSPQVEQKPQPTPSPTANVEKEAPQAKGNETPKGNAEQTHKGTQHIEDKELEQKAVELVKATKKDGKGFMFGKFPPRIAPGEEDSFTWKSFFIKGEEISPNSNRAMSMVHECLINSPVLHLRRDSVRDGRHPYTELPLWVSTYHGKEEGFDLIRFDYVMGLDYPSNYNLSFVWMTTIVPLNLAIQIDKEIEKNPYFIDAFFRALNPGWVGPDRNKDNKRIPAKELEIIDARTRTVETSVKKVVQYPQPIPY